MTAYLKLVLAWGLLTGVCLLMTWIQRRVHWSVWRWATLFLLIYCCYLHSWRYAEEATIQARLLHVEQVVHTPRPSPERRKFTKPLRFPWQR